MGEKQTEAAGRYRSKSLEGILVEIELRGMGKSRRKHQEAIKVEVGKGSWSKRVAGRWKQKETAGSYRNPHSDEVGKKTKQIVPKTLPDMQRNRKHTTSRPTMKYERPKNMHSSI